MSEIGKLPTEKYPGGIGPDQFAADINFRMTPDDLVDVNFPVVTLRKKFDEFDTDYMGDILSRPNEDTNPVAQDKPIRIIGSDGNMLTYVELELTESDGVAGYTASGNRRQLMLTNDGLIPPAFDTTEEFRDKLPELDWADGYLMNRDPSAQPIRVLEEKKAKHLPRREEAAVSAGTTALNAAGGNQDFRTI